VKAVVLVGGEGTRLRPLTYGTPKPLLTIANRPFLEHQLDWLAHHGVDEVVLSIGYKPDAFLAHFGPERRYGRVQLHYAVEDTPLGTAGAIRFATDEAGWSGERVIVCNGDVLTHLDVTALVSLHTERGAEATIALTQVEDPSAFGVVPTDEAGRVLRFVEKPPPGEAPTDWINAGTYVLEASVLASIPPGRAVSIERETFPGLLESERGLYAMASTSYWLDIGSPAKYLQGNLDKLAAGQSLVGDGAAVSDAAEVTDSVIGALCRVAEGARVTGSVVLAGAVIGPKAKIDGSIVGPGARIGDSAEVSELCVIGPDAAVDDGQTLRGERVGGPQV
jgi:NDP-sugar pyrophosphorylase family protein